MNDSKDTEKKQRKKITPKQIAALVCAVLLLSLFVGGLILICLNPDDFGRLFAGWLGGVIGLPILLWLILWSYDLMKKRKNDSRPPQD